MYIGAIHKRRMLIFPISWPLPSFSEKMSSTDRPLLESPNFSCIKYIFLFLFLFCFKKGFLTVSKGICNSHFGNGIWNGSISIFKWSKILVIVIAFTNAYLNHWSTLAFFDGLGNLRLEKVQNCNSNFDSDVRNGAIYISKKIKTGNRNVVWYTFG